ncbi:MAG: hypothetical protein IT198_15570 [Acidimicrobiia bacterium]|nr:hypothetical protein [Acidimicrobiia bacterium]
MKLRARPLIRGSVHVYRRNAALILGTAVIVFAPVAAFEAFFDESVEARTRDLLDLEVLVSLAGVITGIVVSLLVILFYEGVVERIAAVEHRGHPHARPVEILADLPYGRLLVADVLLTAATLVGALFFVVPGLVVLVLFSLTPPIINMERRSVAWSLRRSYRLVRGNFSRVAVVVLGGLTFGELVETGFEALAHALHTGSGGEFVAILASDVVVEPPVTLLIVVTTFILSGVPVDDTGEDARLVSP